MTDIETLRKLLAYDPETGVLTWKPRPVEMFRSGRDAAAWNTRYANKPAFTPVDGAGYVHGRVFGRIYRAHRVVWAIYYGEWPADQIDHINGRRDDNRIANLRDVSHRENSRNRKLRADNTSGVMGVVWHKASRKWAAKIKVDSRYMHLGCFSDFASAVEARKAAEVEHGFCANHGRPA